MYTASTSALINIAFDHITPCMCINIGDGSVSAQTVFDESEQALLTADGMRWQSEQGSLVRYDNLPGVGNILFMEDYVRLKRASVGDVNSAVAGYVLSSDGTVVDGVNGGVAYVGGFNVDDVWNATTRTLTSGTKDSEIDSILADTNELQTNQGQWLTATGFATPTNVTDAQTAIIASVDGLNDFDPALDVVANVTTVGTCTTNTDMRGTDGANTVAPDNASITSILGDTNELQTNQSQWLTATGFATPTNVTDAQAAIIAELDASEVKIDAIETKVQADSRQALLIAEHDATQSSLAGLNDFNPALDVVANVTLVDTVTTNTDMRGTDGANTVVPDNANIIAAATQSTLARKHLTNRDKIDTTANTLIRYDDDGTTPLVTFDLKDGDGGASSTQIFEKDPQ
jgi:hypothetical protein